MTRPRVRTIAWCILVLWWFWWYCGILVVACGCYCQRTHMPWLSLYLHPPLICLINGWAAEPKFAKDGGLEANGIGGVEANGGPRGVEASGIGDGGVEPIGRMAVVVGGWWCWWCCKPNLSDTKSATATAAACTIALPSAPLPPAPLSGPPCRVHHCRERKVLRRPCHRQ